MFLHAYLQNINSDWIQLSKQRLISNIKINLFILDWHSVASLSYALAVQYINEIADKTVQFLLKMTRRYPKFLPEHIDLISFSLSAHLAGRIGKFFKGINKIIALDPAGLSFEGKSKAVTLDESDASFVQVVHTDSNMFKFGSNKIWGTVDIFVNGGHNQVGCKNRRSMSYVSCSHTRATKLYTSSIALYEEATALGQLYDPRNFHYDGDICIFRAYRCTSLKLFDEGKCIECEEKEDCVMLGEQWKIEKVRKKRFINFLDLAQIGLNTFTSTIISLDFTVFQENSPKEVWTNFLYGSISGERKLSKLYTTERQLTDYIPAIRFNSKRAQVIEIQIQFLNVFDGLKQRRKHWKLPKGEIETNKVLKLVEN
ncbi:hypothetical protein SNEBB_008662 [Seison nebaliae]|nr:hypothetical protein SNEBB_008662 [Seison nebaliae]